MDVYDGRIMADMGDVVVVSMNYRLDSEIEFRSLQSWVLFFSELGLLVSCHDWTIVLAIMQVYLTRDSHSNGSRTISRTLAVIRTRFLIHELRTKG